MGTPALTRAWRSRRAVALAGLLRANAFSDLQTFIFTMKYHTLAEAP